MFYRLFSNCKLIQWLKHSYVLIILLTIYLPLVVVVLLSFTDPSSKGNVLTNFQNWNSGSNYVKLFFDSTYYGNFWSGLINSTIMGLIVAPVSVVIGTITTYGIYRSSQQIKQSVLNTSKITVVNPDVITGISLSSLFVITFLPLKISFGWITIVLAQISFTIPYVILTIYPKMSKMNYNIVLASYDLNHKSAKTFVSVVIPYLLPVIVASFLIAFATSFDDFIITNLVKGRVQTLSTELYTMKRGIKSWSITFGALLVLLSVFIILLVSLFKFFNLKRFFCSKYKYEFRLKLPKKPLHPLSKIISLTE